MGGSTRITASFRDPSGFVFERDGTVFRAIDRECAETLQSLAGSGLFGRLQQEGSIVGTRFVPNPYRQWLQADFPGYENFLEHDRVRHLTFPFEWSFSMLAEAGLHTLSLQKELALLGYCLKDASAYNVQFVRGRPVFIDIGSIERARRLDVWFALGQFHRMFLFPLLLCEHCGWDLRSYFLASLDGRNLRQVSRSFGKLGFLRPSLWWDLTLPLVIDRATQARGFNRAAVLETESSNPKPLLMNLERLASKLRRLIRKHKPSGVWKDYSRSCSYEASSTLGKQQLIGEFLKSTHAKSVIDLGCNTGEYSFLASEAGAEVVSADADPDAIEVLFRRLQREPKPIAPLVLDVANPSPAIGFLNEERARFLDRFAPDCVLALALLHHLLISANLTLPGVRDFLCNLTSRYCVLEFIPREDEMFQRLLQLRRDLFEGLSLDSLRHVFQEKFHLLGESPVPDSGRTLLFFSKR
jgi:SAM-dependent methyltransferase